MSNWVEGETFPVAGSRGMTIPWSMAEEAYLEYSPNGRYSQTLLRLAERGGFWVSELDQYIPGWRERVSEITKLKEENTRLATALAAEKTKSERVIKEAKKQDHMLWESIFFEEDGQPVIRSKEFDWNIIEDFSDLLDELAPDTSDEITA